MFVEPNTGSLLWIYWSLFLWEKLVISISKELLPLRLRVLRSLILYHTMTPTKRANATQQMTTTTATTTPVRFERDDSVSIFWLESWIIETSSVTVTSTLPPTSTWSRRLNWRGESVTLSMEIRLCTTPVIALQKLIRCLRSESWKVIAE